VLKSGSASGVERLPWLGITVHRDISPGVVLIITVAMVGLPGHRFLARWFDLVGNPASEVARSVVDLAILRNAAADRMRKEIRALDGWVQVGTGQPLMGLTG
jgi:hypothetical protein